MYNCMAGASCQEGRYNGDDAGAGPGGRLALGEGGPDGLSQRRKVGLQRDMEALANELRAVEADIATKTASAERLRGALATHRGAHHLAQAELDARLRRVDREAQLAARPYLRTADRLDVPL